jgi:hypothetical protein
MTYEMVLKVPDLYYVRVLVKKLVSLSLRKISKSYEQLIGFPFDIKPVVK